MYYIEKGGGHGIFLKKTGGYMTYINYQDDDHVC